VRALAVAAFLLPAAASAQGAAVVGQVTDIADDTAIASADVTVSSGSGPRGSASTSGTGAFQVGGLSENETVTVSVDRTGDTPTHTTTTTAKGSTQVNCWLTRAVMDDQYRARFAETLVKATSDGNAEKKSRMTAALNFMKKEDRDQINEIVNRKMGLKP